MDILIVVGILIVWTIMGIKEALTPEQPPIKDIDAHLRKVQQDFWKKH